MTFLAAYTFSKSMDTASGFNTMNFSNFRVEPFAFVFRRHPQFRDQLQL